jgi:hypothetical protein
MTYTFYIIVTIASRVRFAYAMYVCSLSTVLLQIVRSVRLHALFPASLQAQYDSDPSPIHGHANTVVPVACLPVLLDLEREPSRSFTSDFSEH